MLESKCATASQSLHRRVEPVEHVPLYLFSDPTRSGELDADGWVFAEECERMDHDTPRNVLASVKPEWRPKLNDIDADGLGTVTVTAQPQRTEITIKSSFFSLPGSKLSLDAIADAGSTIAMPATTLELDAGEGSCSSAQCLLTARAKLNSSEEKPWTTPSWYEIDILHDGPEVFTKLAWVLARLPEWSSLKEWQPVGVRFILFFLVSFIFASVEDHRLQPLHTDCRTCCPSSPRVEWRRANNNSIVAYEDGVEAARFEQVRYYLKLTVLLI